MILGDIHDHYSKIIFTIIDVNAGNPDLLPPESIDHSLQEINSCCINNYYLDDLTGQLRSPQPVFQAYIRV